MIRWVRNTPLDIEHQKSFKKAIFITLFGNISLAVIKSIAAYTSGSAAIYADAINSISDVFYSVLLAAGIRISQKPPDISHPQGHERFEPLVALIVTISMAIAGAEASRASINRFLSGGSALALDITLVAMGLSILVKSAMFVTINKIATHLDSPSLHATAKDNITDVATSITAVVGIFGSNLINPLFDPAAGLLVSAWIFKNVWQLAKQNLGYLTGAGADAELRQKLFDTVIRIKGVSNIHHIITEYSGPRLVVEMHINMDGNISLREAHHICDQATDSLEKLPEVDRAYIHIEPLGYE